MSDVDSPVENRWKNPVTYSIAAGVLLLIVLLILWSQGGTENTGKPKRETSTEENSLATARDGLAKNTDLTTRQKEATERDCPECLSSIPIKAKRCMYCTSEVPPVTPPQLVPSD